MTVACLFWAASALAIPTLQLDISGGVYDDAPDVENVVSTGDNFTLYTLLNLAGDDKPSAVSLGDKFYISMAVTPKLAEGSDGLGSFSFFDGSVTYEIDVTGDMEYGTPPVDEYFKDLGPHGIFDTYYYEFEFNFDPALQCAAYNVADNPGGLVDGSEFYYRAFDVDVSGLTEGYEIHFDLYHLDYLKNGKGVVDVAAPFSHDAQSGAIPAPEPSTLLLLGAGLVGLGAYRRRRGKG